MFGPKTSAPDQTDKWVLRYKDKDYLAESFDAVIKWFQDSQVHPDGRLFNPTDQKWWPPDAIVPLVVAHILVTTTPSLDGFRVSRYIGIESVEVVIGTGVMSEFTGGVADFFGQRSTAFEQKLQMAKQLAIQKLRFLALRQGGHAVVGVDLDYTEFSGNRIGVVANGTIVKIEKVGSA